jgi:hypothetical protein
MTIAQPNCRKCKGTGAYLERDLRPDEDDPMPRQCELCFPLEAIESGRSYWLLERGKEEGNFNQPAWWRGEIYDISDFTVDARYAVKYDTKEEAERYRRGFKIPVKVTEHLFGYHNSSGDRKP